MFQLSSVSESIFDGITEGTQDNITEILKQENEKKNATYFSLKLSTRFEKNNSLHLSNSEILFELFPSIFMQYLDIKTFCSLIKTDLWDWHRLLSARILFDYCGFISRRNENEIHKYTQNIQQIDNDHMDIDTDPDYHHQQLEFYSYSYYSDDTCDTIDFDDEEEKECKEIQNFAMLDVTNNLEIIDDLFIFSNFKDVDIIHERTILTEFPEIGLSSKLCKTLSVKNNINNYFHHNHRNHVISFNSFDDLQNEVLQECYDVDDIEDIKKLLILDILELCVKKWYFVEYNEPYSLRINAEKHSGEFIEKNSVKQMIIAHFEKPNIKNVSNTNDTKHEFFVAWSIEFEHILNSEDINMHYIKK